MSESPASRWGTAGRPTPDAYDARWARMAEAGIDPHGEAAFVAAYSPATVLDAGCGTGRVAIELARRGVDVVGVDVDPELLASARTKAPELAWVHDDLATVRLDRRFDVVVLAGNVMIFLAPGSEAAVLANVRAHLAPGGHVVAGFQVHADRLPLATFDALAAGAGLVPAERHATWAREPFRGGDYAVTVLTATA